MTDMDDAPKPTECSHPPRHRRPVFEAPADVVYCSGCFSILTREATAEEVQEAIESVEEADASAFM